MITEFAFMVIFTSVIVTAVYASFVALLVLIIKPFVRRNLPNMPTSVLWWFVFIAFMFPPLFSNVVTANTVHVFDTVMFTYEAESVSYYAMMADAMAEVPDYEMSTPFYPLFRRMSIIWSAGMILLACSFLIQYIRLSRYFSDAKPFDCNKYDIYLKGIKRSVKLYTSARVKTPITYGVIKPRIILPAEFSFTDSALTEYAILHEIWHIRQLDSLFNILWLMLICVYWFNPLVWLFWGLVKKDMEYQCDASVVKTLGYESRAEYARALVELTPVENVHPAFSIPLSSSGIKARIVNIMSMHRPTRLSRAAAIVLLTIMLCIVSFSVILGASTVRKSYGTSFVITYRADVGNVDSEYILLRLTKANTYEMFDYELVGFIDLPPDGLSFSQYSFGLNTYSETLFFSLDCSELIAKGDSTLEWYKVIRKSSFETSNDVITLDEALSLISSLQSSRNFMYVSH